MDTSYCVEQLKALCAIDSTKKSYRAGKPYGQGCFEVLREALHLGESYGFSINNYDNYVGTIDLNDKERQLEILAHLDVVPGGEGWTVTEPFQPVVKDGRIYGRGTADDKGPAVAALYAMRAVRELGIPLKKNVRLVLGTDEECGSTDIEHYYSVEEEAPMTFSPDASFPVINIEKGHFHGQFSAAFEKSGALPRLVSFESGVKSNVVPGKAYALFEGLEGDDVEELVNREILQAVPVSVQEMGIEEARKSGAMALFGEKYGEIVRVVDVCGWSTEFCGGTHVQNTAQIGCFKIISESSVAAGIRRIEAVTGKNLLMRANANELVLRTTAAALKANNLADLAARAEAVMAENKALAKELDAVKAEVAAAKVQSLFESAEDVNGVKIITAYFSGTASGTLRGMCDTLRDKAVKPVLAVLVGSDGGKITMAVSVNKLAQEKGLKAGSIVKELSAIAGGKGGGKPDFAMAGLKDPNKIDEALHAAAEVAASQMN